MQGTPTVFWMIAKLYQREMLAAAERERLVASLRKETKHRPFYRPALCCLGRWLMRLGRTLVEQNEEDRVLTPRKRHA